MMILKWNARFAKFWKKSKEKDISYHNAEELRQLVFACLPVVGPILNTASGYLERLHQSRAIDFADKFKTILEKHHRGRIVAADFKNEDFLEVMESVYSNIIRTKSEYKRERFRNLLTRQLIMPEEAQKGLKIVQLLNDLSDVQIILLDLIKEDYRHERVYNFRSELERYNKSMGEEPYKYNDRINLKIGNSTIVVLNNEIDFYVNDLVTKGLIKSIVTNKLTTNTAKPKVELKYTISYIGMVLLDKIQNFENEQDESQTLQIAENAENIT